MSFGSSSSILVRSFTRRITSSATLVASLTGCFDPHDKPPSNEGTSEDTTSLSVSSSAGQGSSTETVGRSSSASTVADGQSETFSEASSEEEGRSTSMASWEPPTSSETSESASTGMLEDASEAGEGDEAPTLDALIPERGTVSSTISLRGANFGSTQGRSSVLFGAAPGAIVRWTDSEIVAIVPDIYPGPVEVTVVRDGVAAMSRSFTVTLPPMVYISLRSAEREGTIKSQLCAPTSLRDG